MRLLDEPTNHLEIQHQIEILRMVRNLDLANIVALDDLNLTATFRDGIAVLKEGGLIACGPPETVLTQRLLLEVFRVEAEITAGTAGAAPHICFLAA